MSEFDNTLPEFKFKTGNLWSEISTRLKDNLDMQLPVVILNPYSRKEVVWGKFYASIQRDDDSQYLQLEFTNQNFAQSLVETDPSITKLQEGVYRRKIE